jgi:hypothetical protein
MANEFALLSLADSLARRLDNAFPSTLRALHSCTFQSVGSGGLASDLGDSTNAFVTVWPYRVTVNEQMRNRPLEDAMRTPGRRNRPLALDVHLLISIWSGSTAAELSIFAWVMRELHREPVMDASALSTDGGWTSDEVVQLIPAEITVEDMMRIWDAIVPAYRLTAPYVARIVQLDVDEADGMPVLARRFDYGGVAL